MLSEVNQIQKWLKENVGLPVPDGNYIIPIDGVLWVVTCKNDYLSGMRKATKDDIEDSSAWDAYDPLGL
jgi:hypothetical protein